MLFRSVSQSRYDRPPKGWRLMGLPFIRIEASPNSIQKLPITILRQRIARAHWTPFQIHLTDEEGNLLLDTFLLIKAPMIQDFSVIAQQSLFELELGESILKVPLLVYNKGTTDGVYSFAIRNSQAIVEKISPLRVGAGRDTSVVIPIRISSLLLQIS